MTPDYDVTTFETWRLKAEQDYAAASILAEHGGPAATICFLCQQAAEKYLKAYLLLRRRPPKRIHHLDVLLEDCIALDDSFRQLVDDAVFLKRYYIASRYVLCPGRCRSAGEPQLDQLKPSRYGCRSAATYPPEQHASRWQYRNPALANFEHTGTPKCGIFALTKVFTSLTFGSTPDIKRYPMGQKGR
jgi:HEPN domain-containing protein